MRDNMVKSVTAEEIKQVLFSMPSNKAPGPDGFTKEFFKAAWNIVGADFVVAVQSFFIKGFLPHGINSTILTLIPKKEEVFEMKDYRPIACCNVLYKVISKIVANRLKGVLHLFIADNQSAFIKDRLLLENVLLASELVKGYHLSSTTDRCAIKFDIAKAFDSLQWDFVVNILKALNFPDAYIHWVYLCISTPSFSVQVNGELAGYFRSTRGIRQGCALSPYLFVLSMNVLSAKLDKAAREAVFGYHPRCRKVGLTHLCFADDILVFTDGKYTSIASVTQVFDEFAHESGLRVNKEKTSLFLPGGTEETRQLVADNMGYIIDSLPIRYLGLPLMTKRMTRSDYAPLLDKIRNRMVNWSSRFLSFAGRYQLISSVISGIIHFWTAAFWLPRACIKDIERLCSAFLWSGVEMSTRRAKLPWRDICLPRDEGGLGFRDIREANTAYGLKLIWKLITSEDSLWSKWLRLNYLKRRSYWLARSSSGSWIWRKLLLLRNTALSFTKYNIGNGTKAQFWLDNWTPHGRLIDVVGGDGPRVLGIPLAATVREAMDSRTMPREHRDLQYMGIEQILRDLTLSNTSDDTFLWRCGEDKFREGFNMKTTWEQIRRKQPRKSWSKLVWTAFSVPKYAFITWLSMRNRLSTMDRISRWMPAVNTTCILCNQSGESCTHLFFDCSYSRTIWRPLTRRMMGSEYTTSWHSLVHKLSTTTHRDMEKIVLLRMVFQSTIYHIWLERNNRRYNQSSTTSARLKTLIDKSIRNKISALRPATDHTPSKLMLRWFSMTT